MTTAPAWMTAAEAAAFERVKDDGRAEAALLAWWWWKHEAGR